MRPDRSPWWQIQPSARGLVLKFIWIASYTLQWGLKIRMIQFFMQTVIYFANPSLQIHFNWIIQATLRDGDWVVNTQSNYIYSIRQFTNSRIIWFIWNLQRAFPSKICLIYITRFQVKVCFSWCKALMTMLCSDQLFCKNRKYSCS